jgi:tRNA threonylcarbamoyladenosine biosynthesis protein TsaB
VILAVDTASEFASIALIRGDCVVEEVALDSPDGFAHVLFQAVEQLLGRHGVDLAGLEAFAVAAGPGSFTGVRVGLSAAKGLAAATGCLAVAVSNLQALASYGLRELRAPVLDARRGAVFGAVYDGALKLVQEEQVLPFKVWREGLPAGDIEIITNGFPLADAAAEAVRAPRWLAGAVGRIAAARLAAGGGRDAAEIDANYVRRSDAELAWIDARGAREGGSKGVA